VPAEMNATRNTDAAWPSNVRRQAPSASAHSRTVASPAAVATAWPRPARQAACHRHFSGKDLRRVAGPPRLLTLPAARSCQHDWQMHSTSTVNQLWSAPAGCRRGEGHLISNVFLKSLRPACMTGDCGYAERGRAHLVDGRECGRPDAAAVPAQRVQRDQVGQPPHLRG